MQCNGAKNKSKQEQRTQFQKKSKQQQRTQSGGEGTYIIYIHIMERKGNTRAEESTVARLAVELITF
jgi:hypothetical protein